MSDTVRCRQCGQLNRMPPVREGQKAVCGKCKAPLEGTERGPVVATDADFSSLLSKNPKLMVDFWAAWCGPCHAIAPTVEAIARERSDITVAKLNVDENPAAAARYNVSGIPTIVFISEGREAGRLVGAVGRDAIEQAIGRFLGGR